jgi:HAD superfamily hydrolase (TIGR01509 family)
MVTLKRAVLFDLDGVIALTEPLKAEAHASTIRQLGGSVPAELYVKMIGQHHEAVRDAFIQASGIQVDPETYSRIYRSTYGLLLDTKLEIRPGTKELIQVLHNMGYALAIVSSTALSSMTKILKYGELENLFDIYISSEDVQKKKPDPEAYLLALKRMDVQRQNAVILEDSKSGIQAAQQANIRVIGVRHSYNKDKDFDGAFGIIDSFSEVSSIIDIIESSFNK